MSVVKPKRVPENKKVFNFADPTPLVPQKIVGFSGKIGAGKTSCSNFLHAMVFTHVSQSTPYAFVDERGKLMVQDANNHTGEVDVNLKTPEAIQWLTENVWGFIRNFSCAEELKRICMTLFELPYVSMYGTQDQKKEPTHLLWEDMPTKMVGHVKIGQTVPANNIKTGFMSGRDVLEYLGTQILRQMHPDCHANALRKLITTPHPLYGLSQIAIVDDIRFPNEVKALQDIGGLVIRLTKVSKEAAENQHQSNIALDDFDGFNHVIDNENMTMDESFANLMEILFAEQWFVQVN